MVQCQPIDYPFYLHLHVTSMPRNSFIYKCLFLFRKSEPSHLFLLVLCRIVEKDFIYRYIDRYLSLYGALYVKSFNKMIIMCVRTPFNVFMYILRLYVHALLTPIHEIISRNVIRINVEDARFLI